MRDRKGRYAAGTSGNPEGRPQGSVSQLGRELQEAASEILPLWIEAARRGDEDKQRFLLERGLPRFKAQLTEVEVALEGGSDAERIRALFDAAASGSLSPSVAGELVGVLAAAAKVEEIEELRAELAALKSALSRRKKRGEK
ncbi:MAG: hypothetical protein WC956_01865 [bacterium]